MLGFLLDGASLRAGAGPLPMQPACLLQRYNKDIQQINIYAAPSLLKNLLGAARETEIKKIVSALKEFAGEWGARTGT